MRNMDEARHVLCGLDLSVVFSQDAATNMIWFAEIVEEVTGMDRIVAELPNSVSSRIHGETPKFGNHARRPPFERVNIAKVSTTTLDGMMNIVNIGCLNDALSAGTYKEEVSLSMGFPVKSCEDLKPYCEPSLRSMLNGSFS